jgi:F-type H+-transporting ATPase subunit gamma
MVEEVERAQARLDNVRTVEPILSALRTISLGSWKTALKRGTGVRRYGERLTTILQFLVPHLPTRRARFSRFKVALRGSLRMSPSTGSGGTSGRVPHLRPWPASGDPGRAKLDLGGKQAVVLVVGSERGLCGRFNAAVVERAERYLAEQEAKGAQLELLALGSRVLRLLRRRHRPVVWSSKLSAAALPPFHLAFDLTRQWLARYEGGELDAVDLVHNAYRGTGRYEPTVVRLIPPQLPPEQGVSTSRPWLPPIIETDPLSLYARVVGQWTATKLYELLLDSAAAEHSTRYQLMESASQNAERLIAELTLVVQTGRQKEITREMQELAAGAGLIGPQQ